MTAQRADGFGGQVEFDGETVKITRDGRRASGPKRTFLVADALHIDFRPATALVNGYLRFALPGMTTKLVSNDPNGVLFAKKDNDQFVSLNDSLQATLSARGPISEERAAKLAKIYSEGRDALDQSNREEAAAKLEKLTRKMALAEYAGHIIDYKGYRYGLGIKRPIAGATAEFESGADRSRPTLTRIGAGAILAGPVGAIAGGMFKKDKTKGYVTIVFPDGATVIVDGPAKDEKKMRMFAQQVNAIAEAESRLDTASAPLTPAASVATQLMELKQLLDAGVLTDEQYTEKSAPLISQL